MLDLQGIAIPGLNLADGSFTLPIWLAGALLALLVLLLILGLARSGLTGMLAFLALIAIGAGAYWVYSERERIDERRALENRLAELRTHALAAGSPLACLDSSGSEAVESGCERALFAGPESLAAAAAYSATRIALLSDGLKFASRRDPSFESAFDDLRRALEQDRFGIVAYALMVNSGCAADRCEALGMLRDATRVRAALREKTFETLVARHSPHWQTVAMRNGMIMTGGPSNSAAASAVSSAATTPIVESPALAPTPVTVEPPPAPALAAAPTPPRRPAPPRAAQPRPTQAQPAQSPPRVQ